MCMETRVAESEDGVRSQRVRADRRGGSVSSQARLRCRHRRVTTASLLLAPKSSYTGKRAWTCRSRGFRKEIWARVDRIWCID